METIDLADVIKIANTATGKYTSIVPTLHEALIVAAKEDDYTLMKEVIQQFVDEAQKLQTDLQDALTKMVELESVQARRKQYSEEWYQDKVQALSKAFKNDPQEGLSLWLQTYAEALIDWELAICERLTKEAFPFQAQMVDIPVLFQKGTQAIKDENYQQALDMLSYLVQADAPSQSQPVLNETNRAILLVFMGRILLYKVSDSGEVALSHFEQAKALAPKDGRPCAALGEYYRLKKESDKALAYFQQAIELSPEQPDGYIGKGLLSEDRALWDEADDQYEEAIKVVWEEKDIHVALSKLLAPVSGNLYLQFARMLKKKDLERALQFIDYAFTLGIKHDGEYAERLGYRLKGEILEKLKQQEAAAVAYYEAGRRFTWRNEPQVAVELLTQAQKLNPKDADIYWELADALRVCSYRTAPPYVDETLIRKSLDTWETATTIEPSSSIYTLPWIYSERALINELLMRVPHVNVDEWVLNWQAITYLERAILLEETESQYWSSLGMYYRLLNLESSALQATSKAVDYNPEDLDALDERAAILADVGKIDEAEEVIDKRQAREKSTWLDAVKANILIGKDAYQEALTLLQSVIQTLPEDIWCRNLQAFCYFMLGDQLNAKKEYEWVWSQKNKASNTDYMSTLGWAAYSLALLAEDTSNFQYYIDQAIEILSKLCKEPVKSGNNYRNLGLSYLTRGDLALGEESLSEGIMLTKSVQELDEVVKLDFYTIEKYSISWPHGQSVRDILTRLKEKISTRRIQIEQRELSIERELKEVIEKDPHEDGKENWVWLGAHGGLARFYTEAKRWSEATTTYFLLQGEGEHFLEAYLGLANVFYGLQAEGDAHVKEGKSREALENFTQILTLGLLPPNGKTIQGDLYSRLGYVYLDLANMDNAGGYFAKALQLYREDTIADPGSALSEVCRSLLRDATQYWGLDAAWKALADDPTTNEILRSDLEAARKSLANYLSESNQHADALE